MIGRKVGSNAVLNLAGLAAPLVAGAITIPATLRALGPERFGILAFAWVLIGYFSVFDLGLSRATTKFVAGALAKGERDVATVVGSAALMQILLGTVAGGVIWLTASPFVDHVLAVPANLAAEAKGAFSVLAFSVPVVLLTTSLRGTLEAAQRFELVNVVRGPVGVLQFVLPLVGARSGWGLPAIVLSILVLQTVGVVALGALCIRVFPALARPRVEVRTLRTLLQFGRWVAVSGVVGPILVYVDRFAIAALMSVAAVGYYAAAYEMVTRAWIIPVSLVTALFPIFSGQEPSARMEALALRSIRTLLVTMGAVVLVTVVLADDIVRIWLGPRLEDVITLPLQILAVGVFVNSLAYVPYSLLQARGRPDVTGKLHLLELPLHLALVWLLVGAYGLVGAALAWTIRVTIDAIVLYLAAGRVYSLGYRALASTGFTLVAGGVAVLALMAVAISFVPSLPLRIGALVVVLGAVGAGAFVTWTRRLDHVRTGSSLGI